MRYLFNLPEPLAFAYSITQTEHISEIQAQALKNGAVL